MNMETLFKNKRKTLFLMKKSILLVLVVFIHQSLVAQQNETAGLETKFKFRTGAGIPDIKNFDGFAMHNELEMFLNKWLSVSGTVQLSKTGDNASRYQMLSYSPANPEKFDPLLIHTNLSTTEISNFSSVGGYLFLYPMQQASFRFRLGAGVCYNSFEKITTAYFKEFEEAEIFNYMLSVRNAKKMDVGVTFGIEQDLTEKIFVGLNFSGYLAIEEASSFYVIAGFRIH